MITAGAHDRKAIVLRRGGRRGLIVAGGRLDVILVRHHWRDEVHRVVILGRLERDDAQGLAALGRELPAGAQEVRFLLTKVWAGEPGAVQTLVDLAGHLTARGVEHRWVGARAEIAAALVQAGAGAELVEPGPDDVRAGAGWDGGSPFLPAPARTAVVRSS